MKEMYVVDNDYLSARGLNLNDYALDGCIAPIIQTGLDLLVTRMCYLDDNKQGEEAIRAFLVNNPTKVSAFKKAQYRIIYNLIFQSETSPTDAFVDNIIVHEMGCGKINGWQKGIYYSHNR